MSTEVACVVDDRRVLEDRREPVELELRRLEIDRRRQRRRDRARPSRSTAGPARRRSRRRDRSMYSPGVLGFATILPPMPDSASLRPQRELAASIVTIGGCAGELRRSSTLRRRRLRRADRRRGDAARLRDELSSGVHVASPSPTSAVAPVSSSFASSVHVRHRDRRRRAAARRRRRRRRSALRAQPLDDVAHVVAAVGAAPQRHDHAVDLRRRRARPCRAASASASKSTSIAIDVDQRHVAVERAADLDVAQHRVAERDVDRAEPRRRGRASPRACRRPCSRIIHAPTRG